MPIQPEKKAPESINTGGKEDKNIFDQIGITESMNSDKNEVTPKTTKEKLEKISKIMTIVTSVVLVLTFILSADAFLKTAKKDNIFFTSGFIKSGNAMCLRVNGGLDTESLSSDTCASLDKIIEDKTQERKTLKTNIGNELAKLLKEKLKEQLILDSSTTRLIVENRSENRLDHVAIINQIYETMAQTEKDTKTKMACGRLFYKENLYSFECIVEGVTLEQQYKDKSSFTSRTAAAQLLEDFDDIDGLDLVSHPTSIALQDSSNGTQSIIFIELLASNNVFSK